jgi:ankyrin repeat protein
MVANQLIGQLDPTFWKKYQLAQPQDHYKTILMISPVAITGNRELTASLLEP